MAYIALEGFTPDFSKALARSLSKSSAGIWYRDAGIVDNPLRRDEEAMRLLWASHHPLRTYVHRFERIEPDQRLGLFIGKEDGLYLRSEPTDQPWDARERLPHRIILPPGRAEDLTAAVSRCGPYIRGLPPSEYEGLRKPLPLM